MSNSLLDGFEFVASDSIPYITLDNQRRFYIGTSARRLFEVEPYQRLALAYNSSDKAIAIVISDLFESNSRDILTSNYNIDKRYYMSARHFSKRYGYEPEGAPYTFVYDRGASDGSVFIFRLSSE